MKELKVGERVTITLEVVEVVKGCDGCFLMEMVVMQQYHLEWSVLQNIVLMVRI